MTPHFSNKELECKCGCGMLPQKSFMDKIEAIRVIYGKPMRVTSAARCAAYNDSVSTTGRNGPHTTGRAIDIAIERGDALELARIALGHGITGFGVQQKGTGRFLHFDDITGPARPNIWSY